MSKKSLWLDGVVGSQLKDTQGEVLSVEGADISDLESGKGRWNDNHGSGFFNSVGRITEAKKILKKEDCDNDRHAYFWEKIKAPFIYAKGYLYDDEDHPNAKAASAILRNIHKSDSPLKLKASVEGGVVARGVKDPSILQRTKIHSVALTFTPANNATLIEPLNLDKSELNSDSDMALIKSVLHLAKNNVPSFRQIERHVSAEKIISNIKTISSALEKMGIDSIEEPNKEVLVSSALENKIRTNVELINSIVNEKIEKGWKEAALGASLMAAPISSSAQESVKHTAPELVHQEEAKPFSVPSWHKDALFDLAKKNPVLANIAFKESSGAQNYKHKTISNPKSIHFGHTAGGMFAMMPNTAHEILKNSETLRNKYPTMWENAQNIKSNHKKFTHLFNTNPTAAIDFAVEAYDQNRHKFNTDAEFILGWNKGWHGAKKMISAGKNPLDDEYVSSVLGQSKSDLGSFMAQKSRKFKIDKNIVAKAITAGYGAGSPFSLTGGSVMQSESIEGAPKLRYIRCNRCGKEQVHGKYQVKCRECNKNFDLSNLMAALHKR
jgi:hypothetical protein